MKRAKDTGAQVVDTTVGRALLSEILPKGLPFSLVNQNMGKRAISGLINACYRKVGLKETVILPIRLMYLGFRLATRAGASIGMNDMIIPEEKKGILASAETEVKEIENQYPSRSGDQQRTLHNKVVIYGHTPTSRWARR